MPKRKKTKYLVETSAIPVSLGESTAAHCDHFAEQVADGTLHTSVYIRKEFIHRWVRYYIEMAFTADHFSDLPSALFHLNQAFSTRDIKTENHAIAVLLQQKGRINNCRSMAKELGRLAVGELKRFDRLFQSRTRNTCGCQIGGKELKVDYNYFFDDLRRFVTSIGVVTDCRVNEFLGFSRHGSAPRLLEVEGVHKTKAGKELSRLYEERKWTTCVKCAKIGDAVIALEQPNSFCLVHIDHDFKVLCSATNRPYKPILSERAIEKRIVENA
jgi:hypothetical protein